MDGAQASCPALTLGRLETRRLFLNISAQPLDASWLEKSVSRFLAIEGPSELPVTASPVFAVCLKSPLRTGVREAEHREPSAFQQTEIRRELLMKLEGATSG